MKDDFYDKFGFGADGYDREGFDRSGFNRDGFNVHGFDRENYDRKGYHRFSKCNKQGFDRKGVHYLNRPSKKINSELKQQKKQQREETQKLLNAAINNLRANSRAKGNPDLWPLFSEMACWADYKLSGFELPNDALRRAIYRRGALLLHPDRGGDEAQFRKLTLLNDTLKRQLQI